MTKKEYQKNKKRFDEIEKDAIDCYLNETNFDISEWIAEEDMKFWRDFYFIDQGECPICRETEKEKCSC